MDHNPENDPQPGPELPPGEAAHSLVIEHLDGNARISGNATIVEMFGAAELIRQHAHNILEGARIAAQVEQAESQGLLRQLGNLRGGRN